mgnify:CR=1 FL=1
MGRVEQLGTIGSPRAQPDSNSVRSIQIGPFWYKKELSGKSYLLLSLATLLALLQGVCSKTDFPERISRSPLETALGGGHTKFLNPRELNSRTRTGAQRPSKHRV